MNIFATNQDPLEAARDLGYPYNNKMTTETAQLFASCFSERIRRELLPPTSKGTPWKVTHYNHPCAVWVRSKLENWCWLWRYGVELCSCWEAETGKPHATNGFFKALPKALVAQHTPDIDYFNPMFDMGDDPHQTFLDSVNNAPAVSFCICISKDQLCRKHPDFDPSDPVRCYRLYMGIDKKPTWKNKTVYLEPMWYTEIKKQQQ